MRYAPAWASLSWALPRTVQPVSGFSCKPPALVCAAEPDAYQPRMLQGEERKDWRKVRQMTMVRPDTPLTDVLKLLLDAGVSAVPVVDDKVRHRAAGSPHRVARVIFATPGQCMLADVLRRCHVPDCGADVHVPTGVSVPAPNAALNRHCGQAANLCARLPP